MFNMVSDDGKHLLHFIERQKEKEARSKQQARKQEAEAATTTKVVEASL